MGNSQEGWRSDPWDPHLLKKPTNVLCMAAYFYALARKFRAASACLQGVQPTYSPKSSEKPAGANSVPEIRKWSWWRAPHFAGFQQRPLVLGGASPWGACAASLRPRPNAAPPRPAPPRPAPRRGDGQSGGPSASRAGPCGRWFPLLCFCPGPDLGLRSAASRRAERKPTSIRRWWVWV